MNRAMELLGEHRGRLPRIQESFAPSWRRSGEHLRRIRLDWRRFAWTRDGLTHTQFVKQMAQEGHTPSIALLMEVASALDDPAYPDRQEDAKLAQLLLAGVSKTKRAAATKDIAAWLEAEAAQQNVHDINC